ncbi:MAG: hypothetical protein K2Q22_07080, partial [Cytophagales bacterium]|nr:hypothetical protein [Cytophagales bacterium]
MKTLDLIFAIFFMIFLFSFTNSFSQKKREYKFLNDYIKMTVRQLEKDSIFDKGDTLYFLLQNKISSENKIDEKYQTYAFFNQWLDSMNCNKRLKNYELDSDWQKDKIDYAFIVRNFDDVKKAENGFIYITYFNISKPYFYNNYVLTVEQSGTTCIHQTARFKIYEWDERTGNIKIVK